MNRSAIVNKLSELYPNMSVKEIDALVRNIFTCMTESIANDTRIEIRGFGCFSLKKRPAGVIRNPRDGVVIESSARCVVYFRPGKDLKNRVDSSIK